MHNFVKKQPLIYVEFFLSSISSQPSSFIRRCFGSALHSPCHNCSCLGSSMVRQKYCLHSQWFAVLFHISSMAFFLSFQIVTSIYSFLLLPCPAFCKVRARQYGNLAFPNLLCARIYLIGEESVLEAVSLPFTIGYQIISVNQKRIFLPFSIVCI